MKVEYMVWCDRTEADELLKKTRVMYVRRGNWYTFKSQSVANSFFEKYHG